MIISNKINSTFGPAGSFSGYILLIVGLVTINNWAGVILVLIGAFFAFSFTGTAIEIHNNRFRQFTKLFGLFKVGDWEDLSGYSQIVVLKNNSGFRIFSRSNRTILAKENVFLIYMFKSDIRIKVPIKKINSVEIANTEAIKLAAELKMQFIESEQ